MWLNTGSALQYLAQDPSVILKAEAQGADRVPPGRLAKNRTVDLTCGRWSRSPLSFATPQQLGHTLKLRHIPLATPHHKATSHLLSTFLNSLHTISTIEKLNHCLAIQIFCLIKRFHFILNRLKIGIPFNLYLLAWFVQTTVYPRCVVRLTLALLGFLHTPRNRRPFKVVLV